MVPQLTHKRVLGILLLAMVLGGFYLINGKLEERLAPSTTYPSLDLVNMTEAQEWPTELPDNNHIIDFYPHVVPRMGERDGIWLSWGPPLGLDGPTYVVTIHAFDTDVMATNKYSAFNTERFRLPYPILFFLSYPRDVFVPELITLQSTIANQERLGCVERNESNPSFTRCDYIAQYQHLILDVSVVMDDTDDTDATLEVFERLVQSAQEMMETKLALP